MKDFWGNFMGMTLTKSSEGAAFYSADPKGVDHEIAIMQGRPEADASHLIQQISLRVEVAGRRARLQTPSHREGIRD
jgi:hypothetical protein